MSKNSPFDAAGKVDIQELTLITGNAVTVQLQSFLIELNLYEDLYSGGMYGNIVLSDSIGLVYKLTMIGEEYITIKIDTPSFETPIWKTFRCCGISNRMFTKDITTEAYCIHFVSPEVFLDHYIAVQRAFDGNVDDIVEKIYNDYLWHPRRLVVNDGTITDSEDTTNLSIFTECKVPIKFVSPSWSPMKCLSWLASKVQSSKTELPGSNFMFFESNKMFYWCSLEDIIRTQREKQQLAGIYFYTPGNVRQQDDKQTSSIKLGDITYHAPDLARDFFSIHDLQVVKNVDVLQNLQNGYLASVYHELDITKRQYTENKYDHVVRYPYYNHTQLDARGFFADESIRSPYMHQMVGFKHVGLYTGFENNLNERAKDVMPIRTSMLQDLEQVKLKIDIHGRTDIEVGSLIYIYYPQSGPKVESDKNKNIQDTMYSGIYLMSAIHHQITLENHKMIAEVIKDSVGDINTMK